MPGYCRYHDRYRLLFNSYYKSAGKHWIQGERGYLSRPTVAEVLAYREHVDGKITELLESDINNDDINSLIDIGIQHEQQHQELLFMDIKNILAVNPLNPEYSSRSLPKAPVVTENWQTFGEDVYEVGFNGKGFAYDNEKPLHKTYVYPFGISQNSVTNGEYLAFMQDEGYQRPEFWLSLGWVGTGWRRILFSVRFTGNYRITSGMNLPCTVCARWIVTRQLHISVTLRRMPVRVGRNAGFRPSRSMKFS